MSGDASSHFDRAPAAYVVLDDGLITRANAAFVKLVGRPCDEVLGSTLASLWTVAGRIFHETHLMPMLEVEGRVDEVALEVVTADQVRVPVLLSANLERVDGRTRVRAVLFEARHRRRYENDLLRATREAQDARQQAVALAKTLQQTLIPPAPPIVPRLGLAAAYRPAGDGDEVGGDFYDVFNVGGNDWWVVLGDVAGKGIPAATVTSFLRYTVRELAMQVADPAELLHALDRRLWDQATDKFCTVVVLRLCESPDGWTLHGASGGHPLPLLGRRDGTVREIGTHGSLVGILDDAVFTTFTHDLADDEFVVVYTDGVTEARQGTTMYGEAALRGLVSRLAADPAAISAAVIEAMLDYQGGNSSDDIAVLTFHPDAHPAPDRSRAAPHDGPT